MLKSSCGSHLSQSKSRRLHNRLKALPILPLHPLHTTSPPSSPITLPCHMDLLSIPAITCQKDPTLGPLNWLLPLLGPLFPQIPAWLRSHLLQAFFQKSSSQNHTLLHSLPQRWLCFLSSTLPPLEYELIDVMDYVSFVHG